MNNKQKLTNQGKYFIYFFMAGIICFGILVLIYWLILKLTNHSPSANQILLSFVSIIAALTLFILGFTINNCIDIAKMKTELKYANKKLDALCSDFKKFKEYVYQKL
ncbi:MAG: hypothetical protein Q8O89_07850 [Nanoarchaeota archaeon]|nr:hypothetical protein [Nanoarchaeota archaeon]